MTAVTDLAWSLGALMLLSTVTIALRIFVKHRRGRPIRNDDYTVIVAWVRIDRFPSLNISTTSNGLRNVGYGVI
jgi:hypothetical protein